MTKRERDNALGKRIDCARENGWRNVTDIEGVVCALHPFAYTWGIVVGLDDHAMPMRRYCYERLDDAQAAMARYSNPVVNHPPGPWVKCKGQYRGLPVDMCNPALFTPDPMRPGVMIRKDPQDEIEQEG